MKTNHTAEPQAKAAHTPDIRADAITEAVRILRLNHWSVPADQLLAVAAERDRLKDALAKAQSNLSAFATQLRQSAVKAHCALIGKNPPSDIEIIQQEATTALSRDALKASHAELLAAIRGMLSAITDVADARSSAWIADFPTYVHTESAYEAARTAIANAEKL